MLLEAKGMGPGVGMVPAHMMQRHPTQCKFSPEGIPICTWQQGCMLLRSAVM